MFPFQLAIVTHEALPRNSAIRCPESARVKGGCPGESATLVGVATWGPSPSVSRVTSASATGTLTWGS